MSRFIVLFALLTPLSMIQCGGKEPPAVTAPQPTPDAATESPQDAAVQEAAVAAVVDSGPPPPTAQELCMDASGSRLMITLKVPGCGLKLGKTRTDEGRPGVVAFVFGVKSSCAKMEPVTVELMTNPLSQRRFQLTVQDEAGTVFADQMVSTGTLPACGTKKK